MDNRAAVQIGHVIRGRRYASRKTIREVAGHVGGSERTVIHWEKGEKIPSLVNFALLAEALDIDEVAVLAMVRAMSRFGAG